jgi:hypothetical protein
MFGDRGSSAAASTKTGVPFALAMRQIFAMDKGPFAVSGLDMTYTMATCAVSESSSCSAVSTSTTSAPVVRTPKS